MAADTLLKKLDKIQYQCLGMCRALALNYWVSQQGHSQDHPSRWPVAPSVLCPSQWSRQCSEPPTPRSRDGPQDQRDGRPRWGPISAGPFCSDSVAVSTAVTFNDSPLTRKSALMTGGTLERVIFASVLISTTCSPAPPSPRTATLPKQTQIHQN